MAVDPDKKTCACGWPRPLIAITTRTGPAPAAEFIPTYHCPVCGEFYIAAEVSHDVARRVKADLDRELAEAGKRS